MAARLDFDLDQGASWVRSFAVLDDDGNPVDLTDATVVMQARVTLRSPTTLLDVSTASGHISVDGPGGIVSVSIPPAITSTINQSGLYSMVVTYASGEVERLMEGKLILKPEVVR